MSTKQKVPVAVLSRARAVSVASAPKKPQPPEAPKAMKLMPREKVIRALKKLHPMD
ncbi:MAG: hypothetical protein SFW67_13330 [Myxococcaceae bacterium]|nr:hypothetical protein [Myxococcaceae bacterium]